MLKLASRRDPSYLEWHFKKPQQEHLSDKYDCFTEEEWEVHYQASRESTTLAPAKKNDPEQMNEEAKRLACDGCQLFYQEWARNRDLCHPVKGARTPLDRIGETEEDEW